MATELIVKLDLTSRDTALKICSLEQAAYQVEAELIGFDGIPPLHDTVESLQACEEAFYGCYAGDELAGLIAFTVEGGVLDICRVAVHPRFFRQGIAGKLLDFAESVKGIKRMVVSTGRANTPAVSLYLKHGFSWVNDKEVAGGLFVSSFVKDLNR